MTDFAKLYEAADGSAYAEAFVKHLEASAKDAGEKYYQDAADRCDDLMGLLKMWARLDEAKGKDALAKVDLQHADAIAKVKAAL